MPRLPQLAGFLLAIPVLTQTVSADTEFEGAIPVEIVEALFDAYGDSQFAVYSDIADGFPDFPLPQGFTVVGSVYQMSQLRVIFQTQLPEDEALQEFTRVFETQGWIPFPIMRPPVAEVGFISPQQISLGRTSVMCHDDLGSISFRFASRDSGNYLSAGLSQIRIRQQGNCEQQIAMQQASIPRMSRNQGLRQYLPRMVIPETQSVYPGPLFMGGGSSSSNNSVETDGVMRSDQDIDEIYEYFKEQIESQDWVLDTEAVGSRSAIGTWVKSPGPDVDLIGTLSVLDAGDSEFDLRFSLTAEGFTPNPNGIFRSN